MDRKIAQQLLEADDRRVAKVPVKEWPDAEGKPQVCRVRSWSSGDRAAFEAESALIAEHVGEDDRIRLVRARAVAWSWVDESGELMLDLPSRESIKDAAKDGDVCRALQVYLKLANKDVKPIERLYQAVVELNALSEEAEIEIEKNS